MKQKKHLILTQEYLGWEYGMLRCLETEIQRQTGAMILELPKHELMKKTWLQKRLQHGTRYESLRKYLPKVKLKIPLNVDVVWCVLMGPENYGLDLFDWPWRRVPHRVVYLFDTLPSQMKRIGKLFHGPEWNYSITSFQDAIPLLEKATDRKWYHVDQAVSLSYFPFQNSKQIAFSSYGRRHPRVHEAIKKFCRQHSLYYDYTTHGRTAPTANPLELYRQYAWHLSQSKFTVSWRVEITHPERAAGLSPITCRWFEAVAAVAVTIGKAPSNPHFNKIFGAKMVSDINPNEKISKIVQQLNKAWKNRDRLLLEAENRRKKMESKCDWSARVVQILNKIHEQKDASGN